MSRKDLAPGDNGHESQPRLRRSSQKSCDSEVAKSILAAGLPWLFSVMFHVSLFLVMAFIVFIVTRPQDDLEEHIVPDAFMSDMDGGVINPKQNQTTKTPTKTRKRKKFRRKTKVSNDTGRTKTAMSLVSPADSASYSDSDLGLSTSTGTKSSFFGTGGNAHNVVYVVDKSGSLSDTFDLVRMEILRSIGRLKAKQMFHIILFSTGKDVKENKPRKLISATPKNKYQAAHFMKDITPIGGPTNPIPALARAFIVLRKAKKPGRLIYLLTDGDFQSNTKVLRALRRLNKNKKVFVNTFLFSVKVDSAVEVLKKIAKENGGRYKFVDFDFE